MAPTGRSFQSLNDVAESVTNLGSDFRIVFVVRREHPDELSQTLGDLTSIRDAIHPLVEATVQDGRARTESESDSEGRDNTVSEAKTKGWSAGVAVHGGVQLGPFQSGVTTHVDRSSSTTIGRSTSRSARLHPQSERLLGHISRQDNTQVRSGAHRSVPEAAQSMGSTTLGAQAPLRWASLVFANRDAAALIGRLLEGTLAGSHTRDHPLTRLKVNGEVANLLTSSLSVLDPFLPTTPIVPLSRACSALLLPEAELPGLRLRRNVFYGRATRPAEVSVTADHAPRTPGEMIELGVDPFGGPGSSRSSHAC